MLDAVRTNAYITRGVLEVGVQIDQVDNSEKKPLIGIVGGVASGKSTVAAEFKKLGCAVIDADAIAHALLEEPAIHAAVVKRFGAAVLDDSGAIDRRKLALRVFADAQELAALNGILHPRVLQRVEEAVERYGRADTVRAVVLDMPLLVEVGWADRCDRVIFVDSSFERRVARARQKGMLAEGEVEIRENSQISLDSKARLADNTIDNNSDFSTLVRQIQDIFSDITKNS
jgi:dephospho-CoA kinase